MEKKCKRRETGNKGMNKSGKSGRKEGRRYM
jgi:hypothetical protein